MDEPLPRILIVDDPSIAELLSMDLKLHGFEVEIVEEGDQVFAALDAFKPDLVLLDIMLPDMNGLEICRRLRARSTVPMIILTTRDEEMERVRGLEAGADDYVVKPFSFRELTARIRAILRRVAMDHQTLQNQSITIGQITIDPLSRQVYKDQKEVELAAREFDLLALLMGHAGKAISREELLEKVWGKDSVADYRTLFVHIYWLRSKIEDDPAEPVFIQNVRGFGYRFEHPDKI